VPDGL